MFRRRELNDQIKSILAAVLALDIEISAIGDDDVLFDGELGMHSIACIEILAAAEEAFGIRFNDDQIGPGLFRSVNTLAEAVEVHLPPPPFGFGGDSFADAGHRG